MADVFDLNLRMEGKFIPKNKSEELYTDLEDLVDQYCHYEPEEGEDDFFSPQNDIYNDMLRAFKELYKQSLSDNFLWQYCPFQVYEYHMTRRLKTFLDNYSPDCSETDFYIAEIKCICEDHEGIIENELRRGNFGIVYGLIPNRYRAEGTEFYYYIENPSDRFFENSIKSSQTRKIDYLTNRLSQLEQEKLQPTISANNFKKIQTTLTVDQLALLFRILKDESIINKNTEVTNLARALSSIFSTKKADDISPNSLKNHFDKPTEDAIKFWLEKKQPIQTHLTKYKEKYSE